jgi:anthranilate/para-aminobenzoate synthase component II
MFEVFGGVVAHAGEIMHGKTSDMFHDGKGVFQGESFLLSTLLECLSLLALVIPVLVLVEGLPSPFKAVRYHSLAGVPATLPACLEVTCKTSNGVIQGVRHRELSVEGVQVRDSVHWSGNR